jgi:gamma-glutamylcyclotransferase (GGCT)/AIG2-like uncharacterized protein YtfP
MISVISQRMMKYSMRLLLNAERKFVKSEPKEYYFAYGANLSIKRLEKNQIRFTEIGVAKVEGFAIEFSMPCEFNGKGFASLRPEPQSSAWGMLFKVNQLSLAMLDILEWVIFGSYKRIRIDVWVQNQLVRNAWVYVAKNPQKGLKPSRVYLDLILKESERLNFPPSYNSALKNTLAGIKFDLDPGFSLLFQGRRRVFERQMKAIYIVHDRIREALASKLP